MINVCRHTEQRVPVGNTMHYVDMVFYNKIFRAYVLIELKAKDFSPEAAGQLNMYLNYYAAEVNNPDGNPPIGIILCTDKNNVDVEYALGILSNQIFASKFFIHRRLMIIILFEAMVVKLCKI